MVEPFQLKRFKTPIKQKKRVEKVLTIWLKHLNMDIKSNTNTGVQHITIVTIIHLILFESSDFIFPSISL